MKTEFIQKMIIILAAIVIIVISGFLVQWLIPITGSDNIILKNGQVVDLKDNPLTDNKKINHYLLYFRKDLTVKMQRPIKGLFGDENALGCVRFYEKNKNVGLLWVEIDSNKLKSSNFYFGDINTDDILYDDFEITTTLFDSLIYQVVNVKAIWRNVNTREESTGEEFLNKLKNKANLKKEYYEN